ncbi:hypothetical protein KMW28_18930 [Flammeovirga yaeyamensis]|uniref:Lipoprotein n=2 Tax=Flammeovirga yaeyamensis TaxID=367791 RepID=A0AAX1N2M8_9BACT|nr:MULTISPECIES: hypothetical protein [Flammeovirga]ANQ50895.1 hypothetical protein MY04_3547 [Flammeovirga sp. MY04]NMF38444.1 hypothetical protein [Flammeovirga yaeyamensis]QWG01695.1 hypothetical protein KMW28_18930 [Flammeovirga yaeyamensis]
MLSSCFGEPEFPNEPEIEFAWIENRAGGDGDSDSGKQDSIYVGLNFRDGDGDLGLSSDEQDPKYDATIPDPDNPDTTMVNKYHNNYFVDILLKRPDETEFSMITFDDGTSYNGRFPLLNNSGRDRPLEGELRYLILLLVDERIQDIFSEGDSIKFEIHICDRALNESNFITTEGVEIGTSKGKDEEAPTD